MSEKEKLVFETFNLNDLDGEALKTEKKNKLKQNEFVDKMTKFIEWFNLYDLKRYHLENILQKLNGDYELDNNEKSLLQAILAILLNNKNPLDLLTIPRDAKLSDNNVSHISLMYAILTIKEEKKPGEAKKILADYLGISDGSLQKRYLDKYIKGKKLFDSLNIEKPITTANGISDLLNDNNLNEFDKEKITLYLENSYFAYMSIGLYLPDTSDKYWDFSKNRNLGKLLD